MNCLERLVPISIFKAHVNPSSIDLWWTTRHLICILYTEYGYIAVVKLETRKYVCSNIQMENRTYQPNYLYVVSIGKSPSSLRCVSYRFLFIFIWLFFFGRLYFLFNIFLSNFLHPKKKWDIHQPHCLRGCEPNTGHKIPFGVFKVNINDTIKLN